MVSTASNWPLRARKNTVSDGNGPSTARPCAIAARNAGAPHRRIGQRQAAQDPLLRDRFSNLRERDMRGDPRVPQLVEHVEFARRTWMVQSVANEVDLVVIR